MFFLFYSSVPFYAVFPIIGGNIKKASRFDDAAKKTELQWKSLLIYFLVQNKAYQGEIEIFKKREGKTHHFFLHNFFPDEFWQKL